MEAEDHSRTQQTPPASEVFSSSCSRPPPKAKPLPAGQRVWKLLALLLGFTTSFLLLLISHHRLFCFPQNHAAIPVQYQLEQQMQGSPAKQAQPLSTSEKPEGCILYMDDRRETMRSPEAAPFSYWEDRGTELKYWTASKFINRAYARRHGYRFIVGNAGDYWNATERRAASWLKILFMKKQLQCCCQWVFFLDSDAYFRMENHQWSIRDWLVKLKSEEYFLPLVRDAGVDMDGQTWFPQKPVKMLDPQDAKSSLIALFPRNGDNLRGWCGGHDPPGVNVLFGRPDQCAGFINAGVVMLRNSTLTHKFLDDWYNDPAKKNYYRRRPWEQHRVNIIAREYKRHMIVVPLMELSGPEGKQVRHFWKNSSETEEGRHDALKAAALGLIGLLEAEESA